MKKLIRVLVVLTAGAVMAGCEDDSTWQPPPGATPAGRAKAKAKKPKKAKPLSVDFTEADFVESEDSRDPFRDYSRLFVKVKPLPKDNPRKVKAGNSALDELRLAGIVTRSRPRAMLTDGSGFGWVVFTGDYVGKAEMVSTGGTDAQDVAINWRVDRIRPTGVVFIREDAAHPEIPPTTREMLMYPVDPDARGGS